MQERSESTTTTDSLTPELQKLHEEVEAQMAIASKAKRAMEIAEMEIERLRFKLQQSSDRETIIRTIARKSMKEIQAKQDELVIAHIQAIANLANHRKALERAEEAINEQWEAGARQTKWFEEQLVAEQQLAEELQLRMEKEMVQIEVLHDKELKILQTNMGLIQDHYVV